MDEQETEEIKAKVRQKRAQKEQSVTNQKRTDMIRAQTWVSDLLKYLPLCDSHL